MIPATHPRYLLCLPDILKPLKNLFNFFYLFKHDKTSTSFKEDKAQYNHLLARFINVSSRSGKPAERHIRFVAY